MRAAIFTIAMISTLVMTMGMALLAAAPGAASARGTARRGRAGLAQDVEAVHADLLDADRELQEAAVRAAQASEAWDVARYRHHQATLAAFAHDRAARALAQEKDLLIAELAERQRISHKLVTGRQPAPAAKAAAAAATAVVLQENPLETQEEEQHVGTDRGPIPTSHRHHPGPTSGNAPDLASPAPVPVPPSPAGGTPSATESVRTHIGDLYRWGAAGATPTWRGLLLSLDPGPGADGPSCATPRRASGARA